MSLNDNDSDQARTVYVGNIASDTSEDQLYELFLQAGPLEYVKIPVDKASKIAKNFAFICFRHECSVPYAIHLLNDITLHGKRLRVQSRENRMALKNASEVGIHSLDPDFNAKSMGESIKEGSLLTTPPPLILNQPLMTHNPYMMPYQTNQNYGQLYVNSQSYGSGNSSNYQYNHRPMMVDTYSTNNMQNYNDNYSSSQAYSRRNHNLERNYSHSRTDNQNYRDQYPSSRNHEDQYPSSRNHDNSSHRSNEYTNSNSRSHRNQPYNKYNDRNRNRY